MKMLTATGVRRAVPSRARSRRGDNLIRNNFITGARRVADADC